MVFALFGAEVVMAGFGVTPPYVRNTSLTRNSVYEQQILLVRGDPRSELKATVEIDVPVAEDWITILEGDEFLLPRGEQKVPMTVRVEVPNNADFEEFTGAIRVKTGPSDDQVASGAVNISLGAQIDVALNVLDKEIKDFRVRKIAMPDLDEGHKVGWLYFPGKINFGIRFENTGNVDIAPSAVELKIYDNTGTILLEETENKGRVPKIEPYATEQVIAEIPTNLPAGSYLARYQIFNEDDVKQEGEVSLNILPYGTTQAAGFGFTGLSIPHKISIVLPILAIVFLIGFILVINRRQY